MTRSERTRAWLRLGHALSLTLLGVTFGAGAHVLAGGAAPGAGLSAAIILLLTVVSLPLALRPPRWVRAAPLLLGHQLATHVALTTAGVPTDGAPMPIGHHGHANATLSTPASRHVSHDVSPSFAMVCAHAAAAVLLGWLIADTGRSWSVVGQARRAYAIGGRFVNRMVALARQARIISATNVVRVRAHRWLLFVRPERAPLEDLWQALPLVRRGPPLLGR